MGKQGIAYVTVTGLALALAGCGGSSSSSSTDTESDSATITTAEITLPFKAMVGSETVACGKSYQGLGTASSEVTFADFRMFVHNIRLVTDQGEEIALTLDAGQPGQNADVALLDFRDKADVDDNGVILDICQSGDDANPNFKNSITGTVALDAGVSVSDIRFTIGVPFELNHQSQSAAEEPLRNPGLASGMTWNWQNGYKFMAADVLPTGGITRPENPDWSGMRWNIHLGSTGCEVSTSDLEQGTAPETCAAPNRLDVSLPLDGLALDNLAIAIDYAALVSTVNLAQDGGGSPGCMSFAGDPECEKIFNNLALPFGDQDNAGGNPNAVVFSVVEG